MTKSDIAELFMLYGLGFTLLFLTLSVMYYRSFKIEDANNSKSELLLFTRHYSLFVFVGLLSVLLAKAQVGIKYGLPGFLYAILGILCWYNQHLFNKTTNTETIS